MGMFTECLVKIKLKDDTPSGVIDILRHLFHTGDEVPQLPNHSFFKCERWRLTGLCSNGVYYPYNISSTFEIRNYENEIEHFFDWVMPYVRDEEGKCIGYSWHEEALVPTLIYKQKEKDNE